MASILNNGAGAGVVTVAAVGTAATAGVTAVGVPIKTTPGAGLAEVRPWVKMIVALGYLI